MDGHRQSQATLPSTEHPESQQIQPKTNTSVHNSLVSNQEIAGSRLVQGQKQEELNGAQRTKSERLPEANDQNAGNEFQGRKMSKSQGQPSREFIKKEGKSDNPQNYKEELFQASWGGQILLQSQEVFSHPGPQRADVPASNVASQNPSSQASEDLLDFGYPIDEVFNHPVPTIMEERCESQSKMKNIPMEVENKPASLDQLPEPKIIDVPDQGQILQRRSGQISMEIQKKTCPVHSQHSIQEDQIIKVDTPMQIQMKDDENSKKQQSLSHFSDKQGEKSQKAAETEHVEQHNEYKSGDTPVNMEHSPNKHQNSHFFSSDPNKSLRKEPEPSSVQKIGEHHLNSLNSISNSSLINTSEAVQIDSQIFQNIITTTEIPEIPGKQKSKSQQKKQERSQSSNEIIKVNMPMQIQERKDQNKEKSQALSHFSEKQGERHYKQTGVEIHKEQDNRASPIQIENGHNKSQTSHSISSNRNKSPQKQANSSSFSSLSQMNKQKSNSLIQKVIQTAEIPAKEQQHFHKSNQERSQDSNRLHQYYVEVTQANDDNVNQFIKNNDIYGINQREEETASYQNEKKSQKGEKYVQTKTEDFEDVHYEGSRKRSRRFSTTQERQNRAVLAGYYDAKQSEVLKDKLHSPENPQQQKSSIFCNQQNLETKPTLFPSAQIQNQIFEAKIQEPPSLSLEEIIEILVKLTGRADDDEHRYEQFKNTVQRHVDLIFIEGLDRIGDTLLGAGETAKLFVQLLALRESEKMRRPLLERYLLSIIQPKVKKNKQTFQEFKKKYYPQRKIGIFQTHCEKIEGRSSINIQQKSPQPKILKESDDVSQTGSFHNESMQVNNPSVCSGLPSILKSSRKPETYEPHSQMPVRRRQLKKDELKNSKHNRTVQPKGTKRAQRTQKSPREQREVETKKKIVIDEKRHKKLAKEMKSLGMPFNQSDYEIQDESGALGSGYTYLQMKNKDRQSFLRPVRASHRIHQRQLLKPSASKSKSKQSQIKKEVRISVSSHHPQSPNKPRQSLKKHSVRKTNEHLEDDQQLLDVNYIKKHFKEIKFEPTDKVNNLSFTPLSREDQYITELLQKYHELEDEEEVLREDYEREAEESQAGEPFEATVTSKRILESQEVIAQRKEEIRKKIEKYYQTPIEVERIIDPNINNHGIYALLELTKMSSFVFKARYFVTQISNLDYAPKKLIDDDLKTIKGLVDQNERDNIGSIAPDEKILRMIREEQKKRDAARKQ